MMIRAASLPIDVNLQRFSRFMMSQGIGHRINEESGQQVIWVDGEQQAALVREALSRWPFDDEAELQSNRSVGREPLINPIVLLRKGVGAFLRAPISFSLIVGCLWVALYSRLGAQPQNVAILFYPILDTSGLVALIDSVDSFSKILRSLSPMLLHFGELHLVFNMIWLWYFGRQLEPAQPYWLYALLILSCSFVGNTAQYLVSGYNNFGGMSGVVYGLVGYAWMVHTFMPRSTLMINNRMFLVFVIALIAMEVFASSWIASAAHLGGLLAGLVMGLGVVGVFRFILGRSAIGK